MGAITSRQRAGVEEDDVILNTAYKYPPPSGNYFGSHFIMGGERFDTPQPEAYLFGDNSDLNFLGSPTAFPYPPPQPNEPTKTLKSLVNIRKESLRFVRAPADYCKPRIIEGDQRDIELGKGTPFNIEFTFDCDVPCAITIYYFCTEEYTGNGVLYIPKDTSMISDTFRYKRGANQQFCQMSHVFDPTQFSDDELLYDTERKVIPVAIHCVAEKGPEDMRQSHTTIAVIEKGMDGTHILKALKQKLFVDGLCYLLQEIYGIENKNNDKAADDDNEDNGSECVVCMSEVRDTLILPCRHLCLCNSCANTLRYQANNCPICRAPFRALLQIRALQKTATAILPPVNLPDGNCENIPPGYEAVSLIEALNGPHIPRHPPSAMPDLVETPENESAVQAAQILNRHSEDVPVKGKEKDLTGTPEFGMSVLISSRDEDKETPKCPLLSTQVETVSPRTKHSRIREPNRLTSNKSEKDEAADEDSEAEKLSPLLQNVELLTRTNGLALNMADVVEPIDDTDTEHEDTLKSAQHEKKTYNREERGDESDYYTPEEPNIPVQSGALYENGATPSSMESTPQRLPGTPLSHASARSSGDSYTSGSSTRHLLAVANLNGPTEKAVHI
ncbi:mahogunin [Holotrichia oblita]|uniref:Mahogunin n=1 Tax=Holotrichia oblita TaxID=644536 RepID=A0ACB9T1L4_HOLOL|nr:mahogunin [Holotrichia oblita]